MGFRAEGSGVTFSLIKIDSIAYSVAIYTSTNFYCRVRDFLTISLRPRLSKNLPRQGVPRVRLPRWTVEKHRHVLAIG